MELVTIIMPLKEVEAYINESIKSVINQTYKNIELLIIKENVSENLEKIINFYSKNDHRINIITKKTRSIENLKNIGIKESKGNYIVFMESGDIIDKTYIETLMSIQKETKAEIVVTEIYKDKAKKKNDKIEIFNKNEIMEAYLNLKIRSYGKGKLFKKELFKNIEYPVSYYDNFLTSYKIFDNAKKLAFSNLKLYKYIEEKNKKVDDEEHMKKISGCFDMLSFIEKDYAYLTNYCKTKICFEAIDLLKKVEDKTYQKQLFEYIKIYRPYAINDFRIPFKIRAQAIKTLLGLNALKVYLKLEK